MSCKSEEIKNNPLNREFKRRELIAFSMPTIIMMVVISTYSILDVALISRLVSLDSMAAANIAFPVSSILMGIGIMLGRGGSAAVAKKMGEDNQREACSDFSFLVLSGIFIGMITAFLGIFCAEEIALLLGANEVLLKDTVIYLRVLMIFSPFTLLQLMFQSFYVTAGKGKLGMKLMIISGITDAILNVVFMGILQMGILGAGLSTVIGHSISAVVGLLMFYRKKEGLRFLKPSYQWRVLIKSCSNGSAEMVTNLSGGVTTFLFNSVMLGYYGEAGVSAITIITYTQFFLSSIYIGFSSGVAPIFSFHLGAKKEESIKRLRKESLQVITGMSVSITLLSFIFSPMIVRIFADSTETVYELAKTGMKFLAVSFLFTGMNTFVSSYFSAMTRGQISAFISTMRKLVFLVVGIFIFPIFLKANGVWVSILSAEILCGLLCFILLKGEMRESFPKKQREKIK